MAQLWKIVLLIAVVIAANLIAQKLVPTRVSDGFRRRVNYRGAVYFIMMGLLLLVVGVAAIFHL